MTLHPTSIANPSLWIWKTSAEGPFDQLVDYGTLDDLPSEARLRMATLVEDLARPGAAFLFWCSFGAHAELPRISFGRPSRPSPGMEPGQVERLFGASFEIERLPKPAPPDPFACFLMTRR